MWDKADQDPRRQNMTDEERKVQYEPLREEDFRENDFGKETKREGLRKQHYGSNEANAYQWE